jgi:hypothetical protein
VLDIEIFSTIIYIWYEGGELKPPLVRLTFNLAPPAPGPSGAAREVPKRQRTAVIE